MAAIVIMMDIFAPGNKISQLLGPNGLILLQLITVLYFLIRPIFTTLFLGLNKGMKIFLKDILLVAFLLFIFMVIVFVVKR